MQLFVLLSYKEALSPLNVVRAKSRGQKRGDLLRLLCFGSYGFLPYERLLHFLLPFPHMNVKMSKVNYKLIVSQDALIQGSQSCELTTKQRNVLFWILATAFHFLMSVIRLYIHQFTGNHVFANRSHFAPFALQQLSSRCYCTIYIPDLLIRHTGSRRVTRGQMQSGFDETAPCSMNYKYLQVCFILWK